MMGTSLTSFIAGHLYDFLLAKKVTKFDGGRGMSQKLTKSDEGSQAKNDKKVWGWGMVLCGLLSKPKETSFVNSP